MEKLDVYKNQSDVLNDSIDQLVMNLHILKNQHGYKSFVICGCEAGDGSTTVSINLAAALAGSGWKTVLIDGDMRKKRRYKRLGNNKGIEYGLSDYLTDFISLDEITYDTTTDNLKYIPCGELIDNPVRLLCSDKMNKFRDELAKRYAYIIYDMPAVNAAMDAKVMAVSADAVALVTTIGKTSKNGIIEAANALVSVNANLIGAIVNKVDMEQYKAIYEDYDYFRKERYAKRKVRKTLLHINKTTKRIDDTNE